MTVVDESHPGVTTGEISGNPIVDRNAWDNSGEPRAELEAVSTGDEVIVDGDRAVVRSVGTRVNYEQQGLYRFTLDIEGPDPLATLYVDRDPYLLQVTGIRVETIETEEVTVCD